MCRVRFWLSIIIQLHIVFVCIKRTSSNFSQQTKFNEVAERKAITVHDR